ncbi:MAG: ABC transporter ATP-binding protein [Candidatus Methanomethylicia archaeon]
MFWFRFDEEKTERERKYPDRVLIGRLIKLSLNYKLHFTLMVLSVVFRIIFSIASPFIMKYLVDSIVYGSISALTYWSIVYLSLILTSLMANFAGDYSSSYLMSKIMYDLRCKMYNHLYRLRLDQISEEATGKIVSRIMNDVDTIGGMATTGLINMIADMVTLSGAIIMMWSLSPNLSLIIYALIPIIITVNYIIIRKARRAYRETRRKIAEITSRVSQDVSGAAIVQSFSFRRQRNIEEFRRVSEETLRTNVQAEAVSSTMSPLMAIIEAVGVVAILVYGGSLMISGAISLGTLIAFYNYLSSFFRPIRMLVMFLTMIQSTLAATERVFTFLDWEVEKDLGEIEVPPRIGEIEFRNVTFGYKKDIPVLKNVSFKVNPGEFTAIVGPTGAGKTTIINLLLRFYEPWNGEILIDGVNIERYKLNILRSSMIMIPQEPLLISGTVLDNILLANPNANRVDVENAIKTLGLEEIVKTLPKGLETPVLEGGKNLSVGQRQMVSFLRVFISNPTIIILDEATSSIDPHTEAKLQQALEKLIKGKTTIIIAHRLQTITRANKIIVIEDGRIVEEGTHEELLKEGGLYSKLYGIQIEAVSNQNTINNYK